MTIHHVLSRAVFGPEEIRDLAAAYDQVLRKLSLVERSDPFTELIAKKMIPEEITRADLDELLKETVLKGVKVERAPPLTVKVRKILPSPFNQRRPAPELIKNEIDGLKKKAAVPGGTTVAEQRFGLELLTLGERPIVEQRPLGISLLPTGEHLRKRSPCRPLLGGSRVLHHLIDTGQSAPDPPHPRCCGKLFRPCGVGQ